MIKDRFIEALRQNPVCFGYWHDPDYNFGMSAYDVLQFNMDPATEMVRCLRLNRAHNQWELNQEPFHLLCSDFGRMMGQVIPEGQEGPALEEVLKWNQEIWGDEWEWIERNTDKNTLEKNSKNQGQRDFEI